jgi:hypothetical protein
MTESQAIDFLMDRKGEVLSATGWEGYLAAGKGFLVTDGQSISYFPACMVAPFPPVVRRRVQRLVKSYKPTTQIVVLLAVPVDREIMLALGKCTPALTPEEAFLKHCGTDGCPLMEVVFHPPLERPAA